MLSVFLYNQAGYFIAFKLEQYEVRKEIKQKIKNSVPGNELAVITVDRHNRGELIWLEEGREFLYRNQLYDVVRLETKGDATVFYCINDTQEEQLFAELDKHVRGQMETNSSDHKHSHEYTVKNYFTESMQVHFFIDFTAVDFPSFSEALPESFSKNFVPPPEIA